MMTFCRSSTDGLGKRDDRDGGSRRTPPATGTYPQRRAPRRTPLPDR